LLTGNYFVSKNLTLFRYAISVYNLIKIQFSSDPIERRIENRPLCSSRI
jgi:hypothetical protein